MSPATQATRSPAAGALDDPADGGGLVAGGDAERGGEPVRLLPGGEPGGIEVVVGEDRAGGVHGPESGTSGRSRALRGCFDGRPGNLSTLMAASTRSSRAAEGQAR